MRLILAALPLLLLGACASPPAAPAPPDSPQIIHGRELAQKYCAACHATGRRDASPNAEAPAFRTLSDRYPVSDLAESLAEGIVAGHDEMPEIRFPAADVEAMIAYLESIQLHPDPPEAGDQQGGGEPRGAGNKP